ncbi:hypothetical protein [Megavirus chiliensis]|uniref:Uncharacterized protein n=1 Tax=Megavirus chiliensis TaxID=1094892 RepID=A0AAJ6MK96_9VIRU
MTIIDVFTFVIILLFFASMSIAHGTWHFTIIVFIYIIIAYCWFKIVQKN